MIYQPLLGLIEAHGGPEDLDLHGCKIQFQDLSYEALVPYLRVWQRPDRPPWVYGTWGIRLEGAHLEQAQFVGSNLTGADLSKCHLQRTFFFSDKLDRASLVRVQGEGAVILHCSAQEAALQNASLYGANLMATDFGRAMFDGASLRLARLQDARLEEVNLSLSNLRRARLQGVRLARAKIRLANLGRSVGEELAAKGKQPSYAPVAFEDAATVYQDLKANFLSIGHYEEAAWAYIKEQQMRKASFFPTTPGHRWIRYKTRRLIRRMRVLHPRFFRRWPFRLAYALYGAVQHIRLFLGLHPSDLGQAMAEHFEGGKYLRTEYRSRWRWIRNWAYEISTGYGERPQNAVALGISAILTFACVYVLGGWIDNAADALIYSFATFATFNLADVNVEPHGRLMNLLSSVEALLGIGVLALVVFTLGNRMSRS